MTFLRSYADDMKLQEWLFDKVFPAEAKLTSDDVYHLTKLAILEYLRMKDQSRRKRMMTRIYNARILTMEEKRPVFKGEIYIDGGKI